MAHASWLCERHAAGALGQPVPRRGNRHAHAAWGAADMAFDDATAALIAALAGEVDDG